MKPIQFRGKETMSYNKTPLPPAEGAEENIIYHNLTQPFRQILQSVALHGYDIVFAERDCVKCATEFATLHAQKIADKMKEANQFILDIAKTIGIETDGVGFDGLTLNIDDFKEAADKIVEERLREELIAYDKWVGEKYIDNYRHEIAPAIVDEYLKSRESHE